MVPSGRATRQTIKEDSEWQSTTPRLEAQRHRIHLQWSNSDGQRIAHLYYWDEPDTNERHLAEMSAQLIVANLNRWYFGGWVEVTDDPSGRKESKIARQKKR